ncbi:hypothetical protein O3P69_004529 [Scylla paramamosain]|uniref:Secreted protein n=1 Tax=Scylla paramamosain TaxID=85552 RepID=A0AAW0UGH4_SCYPA
MWIPLVLRWWLLGAAAALSICLTSPALANFLQGKYSLPSRFPGTAALSACRSILVGSPCPRPEEIRGRLPFRSPPPDYLALSSLARRKWPVTDYRESGLACSRDSSRGERGLGQIRWGALGLDEFCLHMARGRRERRGE